jgi:diguanylate cyclase (GGDEF)-like protein/PAS domain S-box-containing protein
MRALATLLRPACRTVIRHGKTRAIAPLAALVGLALVLSGVAVFVGSIRQDELQRQSEERIVAQSIRALGRALATATRDYGWWDDAVRSLVTDPDPAWADANIGPYITSTYDYQVSVVIDGAGRPVYGQIDGERGATEAAGLLRDGLGALITMARQRGGAAKPDSVFAVLGGPGGLLAAAASPIVPEPSSSLDRGSGTPSVLVFAKRLDVAFLAGLATDFGLGDLSFVEQLPDDGRAAIRLPTPEAERAWWIAWQPQRPGHGQLGWLLPALLGSVLFCGFTVVVVRSGDRATRAIRESEARFRDIAEATSDWIWETDRDLHLTYVSDHCARETGLDPHEILGRHIHDLLLPPADHESRRESIANLAADGPFRGALYRIVPADGDPRVLRVAGKPVLDGRTLGGYRGTATDITAEISAHEQVRYLAHHDALTGLPNRLLLSSRLRETIACCLRQRATAAVLCLDLDGFKEVNASLGHGAGDMLLTICAERLRACVRAGDTVARQGGDEFTILQSALVRPSDAEQLCRRILLAVSQPFDLDGHRVLVTVSIGVALIPADGVDDARLLQHADIALYRAKNAGRNRFCFFEAGMDQQLRDRLRLESELRSALVAGQLELHYQPQIDIGTGELVGVEALLRWRHPERGLLHPPDFMPLAEETGVIVPLGEWVLRTACTDAARWPGLRVAVNLSAAELRHQDLTERVAGALAAVGLPPDRLELEVTEGLLLYDRPETFATLERLKALGVRIALGDFGAGSSSLSSLRKFPFDRMKIDKSYMLELGGRSATAAIVGAILQLGRSLGIPACAEGVETQDQLTRLSQEGCQEAQGFLLGRPGPAAAVDRMLAQRSRCGRPQAARRRRRARDAMSAV